MWDDNMTRLRRMLELFVIALAAHVYPSFGLQLLDECLAVHVRKYTHYTRLRKNLRRLKARVEKVFFNAVSAKLASVERFVCELLTHDDMAAALSCVFRRSVTDRFGIVTAEFGNVTDHFGDVTD